MRFLNSYTEKIVFYALLVASLFYVWGRPAFISMDGPAHVYNASLLSSYSNSSFLQHYFTLNHIFLPNYLSHWLLQALLAAFDFFTAEKILVSIIVVFLPFTFRLLVKTVTQGVPYFSFLIFPLVFTNLLHYGFYNFCLGFVFFNCQLVLIARLQQQRHIFICWSLLFLNSFLLYYCHIFGYAIAMLVSCLFLASAFDKNKKEAFRKLGLFVLINSPTFIFGLLFAVKTQVPFFDYDLKPFEKASSLMNFSSGIVFDVGEELPYTSLMSLLLIALVAFALTRRFSSHKKLAGTDVFLVLAVLIIYLIFHTTDGAVGGMFVQRLFFLTFYFVMLWVACNAPKSTATWLAMATVLFVFISLYHYRAKAMDGMAKKIIDVEMARNFINEKTIIQPVMLQDEWFQGHISNYLAIKKEVIVLENYEAALAWFPLMWHSSLPRFANNTVVHQPVLRPDYIFVYGDYEKREKMNDSLQDCIHKTMIKLYESSDRFCTLYGRKK